MPTREIKASSLLVGLNCRSTRRPSRPRSRCRLVGGNWSQRLPLTALAGGGERWTGSLIGRGRETWHTSFLWSTRTILLSGLQSGDHLEEVQQPSESYHGSCSFGRQERIVGSVAGSFPLPSVWG